MFKKFTSMMTAAILLAAGLSLTTATHASATAGFQVACTGLTAENVIYIPMTGGTVDVDFDSACSGFVPLTAPTQSGLTTTSKTNATVTSNNGAPTTPGTSWSVTVTGTAVSQADSGIAVATVIAPNSTYAKIVFVTPEFYTNANLGNLSIGTLSPTFASATTTYTTTSSSTNIPISAAAFVSKIGPMKGKSALVSVTCDSTPATLTLNLSTITYSGTCVLTAGATKNIVVRVTALDGTTTKDYTVAVTVSSGGGGGGGGSTCSSELLSSSSTIKGVTFTKGTRQASSTDFNGGGSAFMGSVTLTSAEASGSGITSITTSAGGSARWLYVSPSISSWGNSDISTTANLVGVTLVNNKLFEIKITGSGCTDYYRIMITVGSSGSSQTPQQVAAAAAAAASESAAYLIAAIAKAKVVLASQFGSNKPATLQQFLDANYGVRNSNVADKVSAAILKLPAADRENSDKINAIIKTENFIDRVAVLGTRTSVTSTELTSFGLLPADSVYKYSVVQGLANYPDGSLNSMAKIEAAIKAEIDKAGARKAKTEAIKAKIAARKK